MNIIILELDFRSQGGAIKNFDLERMMGFWHVVQYYASTEELPEYACMRSHFSFSKEDQHVGSLRHQIIVQK